MIKNIISRNWIKIFPECVFAALFIWLAIYRLGELTMPIILDDEFGYWSNCMLLSGNDWTNITGRINYYSYGYSLILCMVNAVADFRGYGWADLYKVAVVFNIIFAVSGYLISVRIAKRYMKHMKGFVIAAVCFVAALYPSNMIYTHITLAESALTFLFWLFAYTMMRVIEMPSVFNHIALAFLAVYMFAVHQRTLGLIITAVAIIFILRLLKINTFRQTVAFCSSLYICFIMHSAMKAYIKGVNYLGQSLGDMHEILTMVFTKKVLAVLAAIMVVLIWFYILDKGRVRISLALFVIAAVVIGGIFIKIMSTVSESDTEFRMSVNELSGQIGVLKNVFTKHGLIRLGTSIVGKWYYLTAATGFVICWGLRDLFLNAILMLWDGCKRTYATVRGKEHVVLAKLGDDFRAHIFLLGMFLSFASAFMICALYKEGLYKVDDLINGRYIEYLIGFILVYSIDRLMADRHWIWFWLVFLGAYIAAGVYCQYVYDLLQRTEYELIHAVVFGRVFWNYESPTGKVREVAKYVIPLSAGFMLLCKTGASRIKNSRIAVFRLILALILPVMAWNHIYTEIVDKYVVVRNQKQSGAVPDLAAWITRLDGNVYFVLDGLSYKQAELIQYICKDQKVILSEFENVDFDKDALFVLNINHLDDDIIKEQCHIIDTRGSYVLVINRNQSLMERWQIYNEQIQLMSGQ